MSAKPAPHVQSFASPDAVYGCWHTHASMDCDAGGDDAPAKHGSHAVALGWSEYVPPGHAEAVASPPWLPAVVVAAVVVHGHSPFCRQQLL